jgi:hypothetical protein
MGLISCHSSRSGAVHPIDQARRLTYRAHALLSARLAALDVGFHSLAQLFQQEGPLQSHLHDRAVEAHPPNPGFLVGGFDFVQAALELDAFAVVCFFDTGGERCACCAFAWDCEMAHQYGTAEDVGGVVLTDWWHCCGLWVSRGLDVRDRGGCVVA